MTVGALEIGDVCFPKNNNNNKKDNGCKQVYRWLCSKHVSALLPMLLCQLIQSLQSLSLCGLWASPESQQGNRDGENGVWNAQKMSQSPAWANPVFLNKTNAHFENVHSGTQVVKRNTDIPLLLIWSWALVLCFSTGFPGWPKPQVMFLHVCVWL